MNQTVKDFFTDSEWDLIYSLVQGNREFCEDDEFDPVSDYDSILSKMQTLFSEPAVGNVNTKDGLTTPW